MLNPCQQVLFWQYLFYKNILTEIFEGEMLIRTLHQLFIFYFVLFIITYKSIIDPDIILTPKQFLTQ